MERTPYAYAIKNENAVIIDWGLTKSGDKMGDLRLTAESLAESFFNENSIEVKGPIAIEFREYGSEDGDIMFRLNPSNKITFSATEIAEVPNEQ